MGWINHGNCAWKEFAQGTFVEIQSLRTLALPQTESGSQSCPMPDAYCVERGSFHESRIEGLA